MNTAQIAIISLFESTASRELIAAQRNVLEHFAPRSRRHWRVRIMYRVASGQGLAATVKLKEVKAVARGKQFDVVILLGAGVIPLCETAFERIIDLATEGALVAAASSATAAPTTAVTRAPLGLALLACSRATINRIDWTDLFATEGAALTERCNAIGVPLTLMSHLSRATDAGNARGEDHGPVFTLQDTPVFQHVRSSRVLESACEAAKEGRTNPKQPLPPIYWINLDRSVPRRARMEARFTEQGLPHTRIAAVDGNDVRDVRRAITAVGVSPHVAACSASHLTAIAQAYADGCERALVMEDDMTFELFTPDAWAQVHAALPERFGAVRLCVAETPRLLDALYEERGTLKSIEKVYWCAGAYVIDRHGMHSVLSKFGFSAPFDVSHFRGEQSPEHLVLQSLKDDPSIRGPFDARVPLFVFEALDSDIHPEEMPQYRRAREFIIQHHSALREDRYRSPFPFASLARKLWSA